MGVHIGYSDNAGCVLPLCFQRTYGRCERGVVIQGCSGVYQSDSSVKERYIMLTGIHKRRIRGVLTKSEVYYGRHGQLRIDQVNTFYGGVNCFNKRDFNAWLVTVHILDKKNYLK